ncbi:MAG: hypothetical protein K5662_06695 [Lachnospiraceae bacterium]|nr:hypothetical protein [Lachnospiraceae bacterium]
MKIEYPTALSNGINPYDDNIDVFVWTEEGKVLTVTVCTPQFYVSYMDKEGLDYVPAGPPDIIVRELTDEIIRDAIQEYCRDNGYWLKTYFLQGNYSLEEMNMMIDSLVHSDGECD